MNLLKSKHKTRRLI